MSTKSAPATLSPLVAVGLRLIAEAEQIKAERDAIAERLKAKDLELATVNGQLIELGTGRYRDEENHTCTVIGAVEPVKAPDTFDLKSAEAEETARKLAGTEFLQLFDRHVYFTPKEDFRGLSKGLLTPKKAESIIALCLIPGQLTGGRRAYVRWR